MKLILKIALFLGAGASVPFKKPTTAQFRTNLTNESARPPYLEHFLTVEKFDDIEKILQSIKLQLEFFPSLGGDFLSESNVQLNLIAGGRNVHFNRDFFVEELKNTEKYVKTKVFDYYRWNYEMNPELKTIYDIIFKKLFKDEEIHVFTTNYDQAIERYCDATSFNLVDGFKHDEGTQQYKWANGDFSYRNETVKENIHLYKLHGSLTWKKHQNGDIIRTHEESMIQDPNFEDNLLIYPTLSPKDGAVLEPYSSIKSQFEKFLHDADVCICIGFSFRDDHINDLFKEFIEKQKLFISVSPTTSNNITNNLIKDDSWEQNEKILSLDEGISNENLENITDKIFGFIHHPI